MTKFFKNKTNHHKFFKINYKLKIQLYKNLYNNQIKIEDHYQEHNFQQKNYKQFNKLNKIKNKLYQLFLNVIIIKINQILKIY